MDTQILLFIKKDCNLELQFLVRLLVNDARESVGKAREQQKDVLVNLAFSNICLLERKRVLYSEYVGVNLCNTGEVMF